MCGVFLLSGWFSCENGLRDCTSEERMELVAGIVADQWKRAW